MTFFMLISYSGLNKIVRPNKIVALPNKKRIKETKLLNRQLNNKTVKRAMHAKNLS